MTAAMFVHPAAGSAAVGDALRLDGEEGRHAAVVRRLRVGEHVLVTDGRGARLEATVTATGRGTLDVVVDGVGEDPAPCPAYTVVQALARGGRDESAVEAMTEVGVDRVAGWQAARSVATWGDGTRRRWEATVRAAGKQARRARWPEVVGPWELAAVLAACREASLALVLHEDATRPLGAVTPPAAGDVVLVVGPEGGLTDDERSQLAAASGVEVRLGPTVLRSSTAGVAALAALLARSRWT